MADNNDLTVAGSLGRIEGKMDIVLNRLSDHEERLRKIESRASWFAGAAAVLGAVGGFLFNLIYPKGH